MIINFLDLEDYSFKVSDSTHSDIINKDNSRFETSKDEVLSIEQLDGTESFEKGKALRYALASFLITAVRALFIPTQTLYHKRSPLMTSCKLRVVKEYSETSIYFKKSETEKNNMSFSKPEFVFDKEFLLIETSFSVDEITKNTNIKKQRLNINTSYILLYVLDLIFAVYGILIKAYTVDMISIFALIFFVICHLVSLHRFKKQQKLYLRDIDYALNYYNDNAVKRE